MKPFEEKFIGICVACGGTSTCNFFESSERFCRNDNCVGAAWPKNEHGRMVTIVPDWNPDRISLSNCIASLPSLKHHDKPPDMFARWADTDAHYPLPDTVNSTSWQSSAYLPYSRDRLAEDFNLSCGNSVVYRSPRLQNWVDLPNVFVLDMSTYTWSRTLKDPKTWVAINVALEHGFRHLAAWTAGNSGLALGLLARHCNHFLSRSEKLWTYALYDRFDVEFDDLVRHTLRMTECELIPVPSIRKRILPPDTIRDKVRYTAESINLEWNDRQFWDVTDGWDAVGLIIYRLVFTQVIRDLQPTHIVAPLGTGNLILGISLAVSDLEAANRNVAIPPQVYGAVPLGLNIMHQIRERQSTPSNTLNSIDRPVMPKITGGFSPLVVCIEQMINRNRVEPIEVDLSDQKAATTVLFRFSTQDRRVLAEPSSVAAFAALPHISDRFLKGDTGERILVVNSGLGLLSKHESQFVPLCGT